MKCLILAAGYATRLYPLTENFPKPLLPVGGKPILDWLVDDLDTAGAIDEYVVISNHKYANHFATWANTKRQKITVIDDGTETNETRLGAVCDVQFAIDSLQIDDDILVIAGDNVLDFSLTAFLHYAEKKGASALMRYYEDDEKRLAKSGVLELGAEDRVLAMEEKPLHPKSRWCCPPFYFYKKEDARLVAEAINAGCTTDAPGSFAAYLCERSIVYAMEMPGHRFDIGNLEGYEKIGKEYKGIVLAE